MELAFSSEEIVFRDEVRAFIAEKLPESARKNGGRWPHWSKEDVVAMAIWSYHPLEAS